MFRKKVVKETYDKENQKPVIRSSICTGEQVAGFKDVHTGKFTEIICIHSSRDLTDFLEKYGLTAAEITKEW